MHILDAEQMRNVQKELLKIELMPNYTLKTPTQSQLGKMGQMVKSIFPKANSQTQNWIHKIVKLTSNMIAIPFIDGNAVFRILIYGLFSIIYSQKNQIQSKEKNNHRNLLLESLKCSLYSKDINFDGIKNKPCQLDSTHSKALVAHFFNYITNLKSNGVSHLNCAVWFLQQNQLLIEIFILLFRSILVHLQVEKADDYQQKGNVEESITNLVEYFDLSYRNFGEMLLFYEQGLFLVVSEKELVFGEYYQNETEIRQSQPHEQTHIQSPENANPINRDSFSSFTNFNPIVQNDMKKFYFMLDSSHSSEVSKGSIHERELEKDIDIETPYFHDNNEQFNFGRKKKDQSIQNSVKQDQMENQFQKLMMDIEEIQSQAESRQLSSLRRQEPLTPCLGIPKETFDMQLSFEKLREKTAQILQIPKPQIKLMEIKQVDSPIYESSEQFNEIHADFQKRGTSKNLVFVKDKSEAPFSPQGQKMTQSNDIFSSQAYESVFRFSSEEKQATQRSSEGINEPIQVISPTYKACDCRFQRLKRNSVSSKVVDFVFCPQKNSNKKDLSKFNSPKFLSLKSIVNLRPSANSKTQLNTPQEQSLDQSQEQIQKKQQRKPTFLKFLKKDKADGLLKERQQQKPSNDISQASQSKISGSLKNKQTSMIINNDKNKEITASSISQQITEKSQRSERKSVSKHKNNLSKCKKIILDQAENLKKYDQSGIMNLRPGFGEPGSWQTASNFCRKSITNPQSNKNGNSIFYDHNNSSEMQSKSPLKFYAPVQIIAPTVYVTNNQGENGSRIFFQMNNQMPGKQNSPEVRKSQNIPTSSQPNYRKEVAKSHHQIDNSGKYSNNKN